MASVVVYIDDEPALCRIFRLILSRLPACEVVTFTDPKAALAYIRENPVTVVVCDYRMPDLNGLQVLDAIEKKIPFFLVSGDLSVKALAGDDARVTGVLTKPLPPERLVDLLLPMIPVRA